MNDGITKEVFAKKCEHKSVYDPTIGPACGPLIDYIHWCLDCGALWLPDEQRWLEVRRDFEKLDLYKGQTCVVGGIKYKVLQGWLTDNGRTVLTMDKKKPHGLTIDQKNRALRIVAVLREKGPLSGSKIARELRKIKDRFAYDDITRNLCKRMVEHGILFRSGAGSTTLWHLVDGWTDDRIDNHLDEKRQPKHCSRELGGCGDLLKMSSGHQLEMYAGEWLCITCIKKRLNK